MAPCDKPSSVVRNADCHLHASTLVVVRQRDVALFGLSVRVGITLDDLPAPIPMLRRPLFVAELAEYLGVDELSELEQSLEQAGLAETSAPTGEFPLFCDPGQSVPMVPLSELLALTKSGRSITGRLTVTADEALWTGADQSLAIAAVGLFVARMSDWPRRAAYGSALTRSDVSVSGDLPTTGDVLWTFGAFNRSPHPIALDLRGRKLSGALKSLAAALDPDSGRLAVAGSLHAATYGTGPGAVTHMSAISADPPSLPDPFHGGPFEMTVVSGGDTDVALAQVKCLSEAAEFLISGAGLAEDATRATANDLDGPWMSPDDVISYHPDHRTRLGVNSFDADEEQWWVPGERAGERIWLPAPLVVGRLPGRRPNWFHPSAVSSSGVAAHPFLHRAIRSAWLEAVERDAFQRCRVLASSAPPASIRASSIRGDEADILRTLMASAEVTVVQLPSPTGRPVLMVRTDTDARIGLGCAADHDPAAALRRALIEAAGQAFGPCQKVDAPEQVRAPSDHADLYSTAKWRSRLDWMRAGHTIGFDEISGAAEELPSQIAVYRYSMSFALPVHVVRVLDPQLIPITFGYDCDPDGRPDFEELCRRAGHLVGTPLDPHPLA